MTQTPGAIRETSIWLSALMVYQIFFYALNTFYDSGAQETNSNAAVIIRDE